VAHLVFYQMGTGVEWPEREADRLLQPSAKVKYVYVFTAWCLIKDRGNLTIRYTLKPHKTTPH
jgi:hypothetical protein